MHFKLNITLFLIPTDRRQTSWPFTSMAECLNSGLPIGLDCESDSRHRQLRHAASTLPFLLLVTSGRIYCKESNIPGFLPKGHRTMTSWLHNNLHSVALAEYISLKKTAEGGRKFSLNVFRFVWNRIFLRENSGGTRTHASEATGALNQRLRPLDHATRYGGPCNCNLFAFHYSWGGDLQLI